MKLISKIFIIILAVIFLPLSLTNCAEQPVTAYVNADITVYDGLNAVEPEEEIAIADSQIPLNESNEGMENDAIETIETVENGIKKDGFAFIYKGAAVYLGEYSDRILSELGTARDYAESDSCTSDGIMKTYYYSGFDFSAYVKDPDSYDSVSDSDKTVKDRIFSISLTDDSVSTAEGIYIGQTVGDMIAVYGAECEEMPGFYYRYIKNGTALSFDVDDDIIIAVTYTLLNIDD